MSQKLQFIEILGKQIKHQIKKFHFGDSFLFQLLLSVFIGYD